ncbi:hypothetical protein ECP03018674_5051, partial [Escherichia coli P0301867.4]
MKSRSRQAAYSMIFTFQLFQTLTFSAGEPTITA